MFFTNWLKGKQGEPIGH